MTKANSPRKGKYGILAFNFKWDEMKSESPYDIMQATTSNIKTTHLGKYLRDMKCENISDLITELKTFLLMLS